MTGTIDRLQQQLEFILEMDKLKSVQRHGLLADGSRRENSAEHSWHLALMTLLLSEYAAQRVDIRKVMLFALVHDIVEVDAGDTLVFDDKANEGKEEREKEAAERLFGLLPEDQGAVFKQLWHEYEFGETPEAKVARALDRLHPVLLHRSNGYVKWKEYGISQSQVFAKLAEVKEATPSLWPLVEQITEEAVKKGFLRPD